MKRTLKRKPKHVVEVGRPADYHRGKPLVLEGNVVVTFRFEGFNLTVERNGDTLHVRNDNGRLTVSPIVGNVIEVQGNTRFG